MDEYRNHNEPWDPGIYGTGRTRPPKNHGGLIAVLLVIVIFLGGLVSVLWCECVPEILVGMLL